MTNLRLATALTNRRQRKTKHHVKLLTEEFEKNPTKWTIDECIVIGEKMGFDRDQVSKWNWDHRRSLNIDTTRRNGQLTKSQPSKILLAVERQR